MSKIADHVRGTSNFVYYRAGNLWYQTDDTHFEFPIPTSDIEGASVEATMKSLNLMRWIRKHLAVSAEAQSAVAGSE